MLTTASVGVSCWPTMTFPKPVSKSSLAACDEAGGAWTGVPQGQSAVSKMGPALPASHGPRTWDVGQAPCEGRPDTRWSGRAPPREQRGRSPSRPAECVRTEETTLDTVNPIQGGGSCLLSGEANFDDHC